MPPILSSLACKNARTTPAVPSGRKQIHSPPLSLNSYISLPTISLLSPTERRKSAVSSSFGVSIKAKPKFCATFAQTPTTCSYKAPSLSKKSLIPRSEFIIFLPYIFSSFSHLVCLNSRILEFFICATSLKVSLLS